MDVCKHTVPPDLQLGDVLVKCHLYVEPATTLDQRIP